MNQALLQQQIEAAVKSALGELYLQLIVAKATQTQLEEEIKHLKIRLSKLTAGTEPEEKQEKGND